MDFKAIKTTLFLTWNLLFFIGCGAISDSRIVVSFSSGNTVVDVEAPGTPAGLSGSSSSSSVIDLTWSAASDNIGVDYYEVHRDGSFLTNVTGLSHSDTGLTANTSYNYQVKAVDAAGNKSDLSSVVNVTTDPPFFIAHIREDCTGYSPCYNTINAWEDAEGGVDYAGAGCAVGDLVCAKVIAQGRISGTWSAPETMRTTINGFTNTSSSYYPMLITTGDARHSGDVSTGSPYSVNPNTVGHAFIIDNDWVLVDGLIITDPLGSSSEGFRVFGDNFTVKNTIFHDFNNNSNQDGVFPGNSSITVNIINCLFYNIRRTSVHIQGLTNVTVNVYNSTIYDVPSSTFTATNYGGIGFDSSTPSTGSVMNIYNTYVEPLIARDSYKLTTGASWGSSTNNLSSDAIIAGGGGVINVTSTTNTSPGAGNFIIFTNLTPGSEDFHLQASASNIAVDGGSDQSSILTTDFEGDTRSTFDIGVDEL